MKHTLIFLSLVLLTAFSGSSAVKAQEILTLQDAVKIALENNYDIKLAVNNTKIDANNVTIGNAGMLPRIDATLADNNAIQTTSQTRSDGTVQERSNARNTSLNYGVGLNWTIFDGFGMFARHDQLKEFRNLGEAEQKLAILTTVGDVMNTYFALVQQQQTLRAYDTTVFISRQRVNTAQVRFEIGKAARLEVLNAQVDFNTDTTNLLRQHERYRTTQVRMNELLARDVNTKFIVVETLNIDRQLTREQLAEQALKQNPTVQAAVVNKRIAELDLKIVRANRFPVVGLNSGYNFGRSTSALGFTTQASNHGFNYGVTASVNIFDGFNQRRVEQNARILMDNTQLDLNRIMQDINAQLSTAYQIYQTSLTLVDLEKNNEEIAKRNLEITLDKFNLGSISSVDFRLAQVNYINATIRHNEALFQAKLAEVSLKEISGNLSL